jgi:hypothetical protein
MHTMRPENIIWYCTGVIVVCTALMTFVSVVTVRNLQLLRDLVGQPPGAHDEPDTSDAAARRRRGVATAQVQRFDSGVPLEPRATADEWTGPVTTYVPADRPKAP